MLGASAYAREYVPRNELPRVRRWIRRARAEAAFGRGQADSYAALWPAFDEPSPTAMQPTESLAADRRHLIGRRSL
jgi:hypothetical protein